MSDYQAGYAGPVYIEQMIDAEGNDCGAEDHAGLRFVGQEPAYTREQLAKVVRDGKKRAK